MTDSHYIHTNKYVLEIQESWEDRKMQMVLTYKIDNSKVRCMVGSVPSEWMEDDEDETRKKLPDELMKGEKEDRTRRKLKRYRQLHVKLSTPPIIRLHNQDVPLLLKDETLDGALRPIYSKEEGNKKDAYINSGVKYWRRLGEKIVLDPYNSCIHFSLLERGPVRVYEGRIAPTSLSEPDKSSLLTVFMDLQKPESSERLPLRQ